MSELEKDAILHLKKMYVDTNESEKCLALKTAIGALSRRIPKKPIKYGDTRQGLDNDGNSISWQEDCFECPNCESFLGYVKDCEDESCQDNYCRCCGQSLDWMDIYG